MRALTDETLLAAWERGLRASEPRAALAALSLAEPGRSFSEWARLPLGERNVMLLELRAASMGRRLDGFAPCPECGAKLEFTLDALELARGLREQIEASPATAGGRRLRPANTLDLLAASEAADEEEAGEILLARTLRADEQEEAAEAEMWLRQQPPEVVADLMRVFDIVNSAAEIRAQFRCAGCGGDASVDVDAATFLIEEISIAARRLLSEIHELASAYGWSEQAILALSAARRSAYLELLRA